MLNQRLAAAELVFPALRDAETASDQFLVQSANLVAAIAGARSIGGLAITVGHAALEEAWAHLETAMQARRRIISTHGALAEVRDLLGLGSKIPASLSGPLGDKPDSVAPELSNGAEVVKLTPTRAA